jgi:alpha-amylase/alpha-mannosidase (GH57 family)
MTNAAFCIHAHFYQPPREDPLTGVIPREEGAFPYENWNERIHEQCYKPNSELGNFARISFNLGPTVLEWMSEYDPETLDGIVRQEQAIYKITGLPTGMAQAYNHTILPLASIKEKHTQILWGMKEFEIRFGHKADGIWLPEAGVDLETLRVANECGAEYVILAPWQCADTGKDLDRPGWVELGNGKRMVVFFYNQILSTRVSFDPGATRNADEFLVNAILPELSNGVGGSEEKFLIIASDGELYGHHQRFRDQFLMRLTTNAFKGKPVQLMTPAAWLKKYPPSQTFKIVERSSWSCHHGVLRWSGECGCTQNSQWKAPLRSGLDLVADLVDRVYEQVWEKCGADPQAVLDDYVQVLLGRISHNDFVSEKLSLKPGEGSYRAAIQILRAQYERQRMFTSCGWFFDDFDRIEPRNNVKYAAQAIWLTQQVKPELSITPILDELNKVVSLRSNLKADYVFRNHLQAAQSAWVETSSRT